MKKFIKTLLHNLLLAFLAFIWLVPIVWLVVTSFSAYNGPNTNTFFPKEWSIAQYQKLLFSADSVAQFPNWFKNTFLIACAVCVISTIFVLMVAYATSCMRFPARKPLMNAAVIVNLFPGVLSMIAVYFILKTLNLTNTHFGLILVYSAGSGLGYLIAKGFFDTIPRSIDEAAYIDGATKWNVFRLITIPLSKSIIVYTVLTSFIAPWIDFVLAKVIIGTDAKYYTVAIGLWNMLEKENIYQWYTRFAAGAVCVSIPIAVLFLFMQRCYTDGLTGAVKG